MGVHVFSVFFLSFSSVEPLDYKTLILSYWVVIDPYIVHFFSNTNPFSAKPNPFSVNPSLGLNFQLRVSFTSE